jgi:type I restriction enzyme S subunit
MTEEQIYERSCSFRLPSNWIWGKLEDLVLKPKDDIVDGPFGSNLKASSYVDYGIPIIRLQNIDRNFFAHKNMKYISQQKAQELKRHNFSKGDVVITKLGAPLGKACIVPDYIGQGIIVADVVRLRVPEGLVSKKYLVYALNSEIVANQLKQRTKGTTRPRVNLNHIRKLAIAIAPLNEQNRILSKLEALFSFLDAGTESLRKVQAQLKLYRQAVLKYAFEGKLTEVWRKTNKAKIESRHELIECTILNQKKNSFEKRVEELPSLFRLKLPILPQEWDWVQINECCEVVSGYAFQSKDFVKSQEIPVVKIGNVGYCEFLWQDQEYLPQSFFNDYSKYKVLPNSILLALTRPITNDTLKVCLYPSDTETGILNQRVAIINPIRWLSKEVLFLYMQSSIFKNQVLGGMSQTLQPNLSPTTLGRFLIPLFSSLEQKKIVTEIERSLSVSSKIGDQVTQSLRQLGSLRQSILKEAFSGNLVTQDQNDETAEKLLERIKAKRHTTNKDIRNNLELSEYVK